MSLCVNLHLQWTVNEYLFKLPSLILSISAAAATLMTHQSEVSLFWLIFLSFWFWGFLRIFIFNLRKSIFMLKESVKADSKKTISLLGTNYAIHVKQLTYLFTYLTFPGGFSLKASISPAIRFVFLYHSFGSWALKNTNFCVNNPQKQFKGG